MAVDARLSSRPAAPHVVRMAAAGIQRGDQVAFSSTDGEGGDDVAGGVTGVRHSADRSTVTLMVGDRMHLLHAHHGVIIIRGIPDTGV